MNRYSMYMRLRDLYSNHTLAATMDIKFIAMCHLLRPSKYVSHCYRQYGKLLEHNFHTSRNEVPELQATAKLWEEQYGENYLNTFGEGICWMI